MTIGPMKIEPAQTLSMVLAAVLGAAVGLAAQQPAPPPPAAAAPRPPIGRPVVDPAAHDRGRALWASHCIDCHGAQARGSDTGPNIIRTKTANYDRSAQQAGSVLGPFLKAGHPTQSKKPGASFTDAEIADLANFLRQRINDTMRGSPIFTVGDIVTGDAKAGEATAVIPVKGMHCGGCVGHVNDAVKKLSGVKSVNTDLDKAQTTVVFDAAAVKPEQIVSAIAETGYEPGKPVVK
jgi:copper ion binding protein